MSSEHLWQRSAEYTTFSKHLGWRWIPAPGGLGVRCSLVLGCSLGLAARCWSTSSVRLLCPHSTRMGESWWNIPPHRTGTGLVSTGRKIRYLMSQSCVSSPFVLSVKSIPLYMVILKLYNSSFKTLYIIYLLICLFTDAEKWGAIVK